MDKPVISIIMPFYNVEAYLATCIYSIQRQSFKAWELLLIDDGSTDRSLNIAQHFLSDSRIKLFSDGVNKGLAPRLNEGIEAAEGEYIARMDADDFMVSSRLETQYSFMMLNPEVDVIGSYAFAIDGENKIIGLIRQDLPETFDKLLISGNFFCHPTVMARTEWFRQNKYDVSMNRIEDFELWIRTYAYSRFEVLKQPLLFYRTGEDIPQWKYKAALQTIVKMIQNKKHPISFQVGWLMRIRGYLRFLFYKPLRNFGLLYRNRKPFSITPNDPNQIDLNSILENSKFKIG